MRFTSPAMARTGAPSAASRPAAMWTTFPALEGSARYVRMQGLRRATHWGYSLFEFEVHRDGINIAAGRPMKASSS